MSMARSPGRPGSPGPQRQASERGTSEGCREDRFPYLKSRHRGANLVKLSSESIFTVRCKRWQFTW